MSVSPPSQPPTAQQRQMQAELSKRRQLVEREVRKDATYTVRSLRSKVAQMPRARAQAIIEARSDVSSAVRSLMLQREWETAIEVMVLEQTDRFTDERVLDFTLPASVEAAEFPKSTWSPLHIAALMLAGGAILIGMRWLASGATHARIARPPAAVSQPQIEPSPWSSENGGWLF